MSNCAPTVCILMATFNGEKYIKKQIESIRCQSYKNWILLIRDDKSTDETLKILNQLSQIDSRIKLISDNKGNLGAKKNFSELMKLGYRTNSHYFLFADQDDYWVKNKIKIMLREIAVRESSFNRHLPILIYSDLEIVNEKLELIAPSFMKYQLINYPKVDISIGQLLVQNIVTGCASIFNRKLLFIAKNIPDEAIVHDWWIALCAASCGRIYFIPTSLVKYRQHDNNLIGAKGAFGEMNLFSKSFYLKVKKSKGNYLKLFNQAHALTLIDFVFKHCDYIIPIMQFANIYEVGLIHRIKILVKLKVIRSTFLHTIYAWLRILSINNNE